MTEALSDYCIEASLIEIQFGFGRIFVQFFGF